MLLRPMGGGGLGCGYAVLHLFTSIIPSAPNDNNVS